MHSLILRFASLLILSSSLMEAAVEDWGFVKGRGGQLVADSQEPALASYDVELFVEVGSAGDASSVTISGGGINGTLNFELDGTEWIYAQDFQSEAQLDAVFPNNASYTLTLSGGSLGTLTQTVSVGDKTYPGVPYLTGNGFSTLQSFDPKTSFDFDFATPSSEADLIFIEIEDGDNFPFESEGPASQTTVNMPADTLSSGKVYECYFDHASQVVQSGAGGFGVDGAVYHTAYSWFNIDAASANSIIGAWSYGDTSTDGSGIVMFMKDLSYYLIEDVNPSDPDADGFEVGTYAWNEQTGVFTATQRLDSNGEAGLSHPVGSVTVTVSGDSMTYADSEGSTVLARAKDEGNPLVGAWQYGEARVVDSRALVFLPNGIYFEAQEFGSQAGMEKGRYTWDEATGIFEVEVLVDTDDDLAFSYEFEGFNLRIQGDEMLIVDGDREWRLYLVDPSTVGYPVPAVTHWRFIKGRDHFQNKNNTSPAAAAWSVYVVVETRLNQDALDMEMRVAGQPGSYDLVQNSARGWTFEKDYHSEAAMNAAFPAGSEITIELSGGWLGTMSQTFSLMADQYPNTPYLTGTKFTDAQNFDSFADFQLTWNSPGSLTQNSGQTILEVFERYDDDIVFRESTIGAATQGTVPAGTVWAGHTFYGYLEYTHARSIDGTGGFEVAGTESRNVAVDFTLGTPDSPLAGAWSFGDPSGDNSGVLVFLNNGTFFHIEDVSAGSSDPDGFERGEYTWDRDTGAFGFEVLVDTNGTVGLSDSGDTQTIVVSGNSLTFTDDGEAEVLPKVTSASDGLIGGWQYGDGREEFGAVYVFMDNGYYFGLVYDDFEGLSLDAGIERGSYTFAEVDLVPVLEVTTLTDTNGERGLSHVDGEWSSYLFNDRFGFSDNRGGEGFVDAEKADVLERMSVSDPNLKSAFRTASGKLSGELLRIDVQRILRMDASGRGIMEVEGLNEAYNIRELDLSNNLIEDIWQVGDLLDLRVLDLSNNKISNISYLSSLTKLVSLDLSHNELSDASQGATIDPGLVSLFSDPRPLASTGVLAPLDGIDTLNTLRFADNAISDLSALSTLPELTEIDLSGNEVDDISVLQQLPKLKNIAVFGNPVDLTEGSEQRLLLDSIATNNGAVILLEAPDPYATFLKWERDELNARYRLIWTEPGVLQWSTDMESWINLDSAVSPHPVDLINTSPLFWRLDF